MFQFEPKCPGVQPLRRIAVYAPALVVLSVLYRVEPALGRYAPLREANQLFGRGE